jgi:hypothetical protein
MADPANTFNIPPNEQGTSTRGTGDANDFNSY